MTTGDLAQEQPLPEDAFHLRPYTLACKVDDGFPTNNLVFEYGPKQLITDIRGLAHMSLSLEKNGFCNVRNDFKSMANDEESITRPGGYLDELKALTRDTFKSQGLVAEDVRVINWVHRAAKEDTLFKNETISGGDFKGHAPDTYVHNDCNFFGGDKRIRAVLGDQTTEILASKRIRIINAWRPINNAVQDCHLAICDATTVEHDKCMHGDFIVSPEYTDEVTFFKQHDTDESSNTRYCPHGAFWKDDPALCTIPRESIEVRLLIVSPKL
ncbi:hypothetical protein BGZ57DRAFT_989670 [Hyaloscypha finlandica]|nr:hypothetical protein BGZ57DRAFT_989670 [Hyaloscypha finlandica]